MVRMSQESQEHKQEIKQWGRSGNPSLHLWDLRTCLFLVFTPSLHFDKPEEGLKIGIMTGGCYRIGGLLCLYKSGYNEQGRGGAWGKSPEGIKKQLRG